MSRTFIFETSHLALWAEDVARERGIHAQLGPAPSAAEDKCGLALRTGDADATALEAALRAEGIEFRTL